MASYNAPPPAPKAKPAYRVTPLEGERPREITTFVRDPETKQHSVVKSVVMEPAGYLVEFPMKRHAGKQADSLRVRTYEELVRLGFHHALPEHEGEVPLVDPETSMVVGTTVNRPNRRTKEG